MTSDDAGWYGEPPIAGFQQSYEVVARLFRSTSAYQEIEIIDTVPLGRVLLLNGAVQTSEKDEFIYHEMLTLVPLLTHGQAQRAAIVGGGDGGTLRRVLQFPTITEAYQIELDQAVTDTCLQYLPTISDGAFDDPRARVQFGDGARFLRETEQKFDVILVDSTDPIGPAEVLFSEGFYRDVDQALAEGGILVTQSGSPLLMADELAQALGNLRKVFKLVRVYLASIPGYPGVLWSFTLASQGPDPLAIGQDELERRLRTTGIAPQYYTPDVHRAAFAVPPFIAARLKDEKSFGPFTS